MHNVWLQVMLGPTLEAISEWVLDSSRNEYSINNKGYNNINTNGAENGLSTPDEVKGGLMGVVDALVGLSISLLGGEALTGADSIGAIPDNSDNSKVNMKLYYHYISLTNSISLLIFLVTMINI